MPRTSKRKQAASGGDRPSKRSNDAYDSDEAPPPVRSNQDKSLWRQDPEESLSDWTIEISYEGKNNKTKTDTYHVHRALLAAGPRKSEYFARLFQDGGRFAESNNKTSQIELEQISAKAFPQLLDYLYSVDAPLEIWTDTATALHHLGGYFEIRRLRWDAKQFWQRDLKASNCGTYLEHARILNDDKVKEAAAKKCRDEILQIDEKSRLLHIPDEDFWIGLVEGSEVTSEFSLHLSKLLGAFFVNCGASKATFQKLTLAKSLPEVHCDAAIKLIDAEREIVEPGESRLTDLQNRCIKALCDNWSNFDELAQRDIALLQKQSPFLLTKALREFAKRAKKDAERTAKNEADQAVKHEQAKFVRVPYGMIVSQASGSTVHHQQVARHPQDTPQSSGWYARPNWYCESVRAVYYYNG
jgi:hypothetical protein